MYSLFQLHFWLYTHYEWFRNYGDALIIGIIAGMLIPIF